MAALTETTALQADPEAVLLSDALGVPTDRLLSREPLGRGSVTGFAVTQDGGEHQWYVDTSHLAVPRETGLATGEDPRHPDARLWQHPADPHLPALAPAAFGQSAQALLSRLGVAATGEVAIVAYRPGRRAVLRMPTADGAVWVKVVRPGRVERVVRAHTTCADAGLPVPVLLGWSPEGLIVLASALGQPAPAVQWEPEWLLDRVDGLRDSIARVPWSTPTKSVADRLDWYAHRIPDAHDLVTRVRARLATTSERQPHVSHGDLHFGQLFLDADGIAGVIDVDTFGVAPAAEDPAAFIGHAVASALLTPDFDRPRVWRLADLALARWDTPHVRAFTAVHLLGQSIAARYGGDDAGAVQLLSAASRIVSGGPAGPDS